MKILIADADPALRATVKEAFASFYCFFREASTIQEALAALNSDPIELLLLDANLNGEDGLEVLRNLRSGGRALKVPTVIMTANPSRELVNETLALGVRGFLSKPFRQQVLLERVQQVATIKRRPDKQVLAENASAPREKRPLEHPRRVLLVEPENERRDAITRLLEPSEWSVTVCPSIFHAREHLASTHADYLFINADLCVGHNSLEELLGSAAHLPGREAPNLVALGHAGDSELMIRVKELGIEDFILEPITFEKLEKLARTLIQKGTA